MKITYEKIMQTSILVVLLASLAVVFFAVNPTADQNHRDFVKQQKLLQRQTQRQHRLVCAQAQSTANAFRFRQIGPHGHIEKVPHFLTRMQAQAETLELSKGAGCQSAPGLPPFEAQVKNALEQIHRIFTRFSPSQPQEEAAEAIDPGTPIKPAEPMPAVHEGKPVAGIDPAHGVSHEAVEEPLPPVTFPRAEEPPAVSVAPAEVLPAPPTVAVVVPVEVSVPLCSAIRAIANVC